MNTIADWEQWVKLAHENPQEFERKRASAIEELIMSQPVESRRRSRQLQWRIDGIRLTSPNSLAACVKIYDMMIETVYGPDGLLDAIALLTDRTGKLDGFLAATDKVAARNSRPCLEFRQKKRSKE